MPKAGPNDVVLQVKASACNFNDIWARRGLPGMKIILPHISGSDASGVVVETGSEVHNVKVGDEVVVHCGIACRQCDYCTRGEEFFCPDFKIWGFQTGPLDGAHGDYCRVPAVNVLPKPRNLTHVEAATMPLVLVTVWRMLVTRARIQAGDFVLVWGAAGGLGVMAIQIAKLYNARPIAVASGDDKLELCSKLGAEFVLHRKKHDVFQEVRKITGRPPRRHRLRAHRRGYLANLDAMPQVGRHDRDLRRNFGLRRPPRYPAVVEQAAKLSGFASGQ